MALITYLTRIEFDDGALARLPAIAEELSLKRPLIVSDPGLAQTGLVKRVADLLRRSSATYAETPANPTEEAVEAALAVYREADCDGVVAVGGGSSIDLAKAVRLLATH